MVQLISDWCLPGKSWFLIGSGLVKSIVGREAINELSSKADRPISLMESLITDRQAQVRVCVSLTIQNYFSDNFSEFSKLCNSLINQGYFPDHWSPSPGHWSGFVSHLLFKMCLTYYSKLIRRFSPRIPDSFCCVAKNRLADYPQVLDRVSLAEYRICLISFGSLPRNERKVVQVLWILLTRRWWYSQSPRMALNCIGVSDLNPQIWQGLLRPTIRS